MSVEELAVDKQVIILSSNPALDLNLGAALTKPAGKAAKPS